MKKIFITGCTGYIGSHTCVELLNAGYEIVGLDNFSNSKKEVLDRIVEHREEFSAMRKNARQTVQKHFNYTEYKGILDSFLEEMRL